jgi:hypothetical protein
MRLKRIALPALVGGFAIVSGFVAMPLMASSNEIEIEYVPLDGAAVEATNGWQWHPPMALPVDVQTLPVSEQVDPTDTSYLQRPTDMPAVGPAGYED